MLSELRIKNFAIIQSLSLSLRPGLNVLTGETGAGKSILVEALGVALGDRAYTEMIKSGFEQATVEAMFDMKTHPYLESLGIDIKDGIIFRRDISTTGKSRAYVNDTMTSVQSLLEAGKTLVDMHGQHSHQSLLSQENQLSVIDAFGRLGEERTAIGALFNEVNGLRKKLDGLRLGLRERAQKADMLKYQINEIETAGLKPLEDEALDEERNLLSHQARLRELAENIHLKLHSDDGSAIERLSQSLTDLREMAGIDKSLESALEVLASAVPLVEEASISVRDARDNYESDPSRLEAVEDRIHLIKSLKKKYGDTIEAIAEYLSNIKEELTAIECSDETAVEIEAELAKKESALIIQAEALSQKRKKSAEKIEKAVTPVLHELSMPKAVFKIEFKAVAVGSTGMDAVEFMLSANPGEPPKPIAKVASGGELSRVMLALKSVLSKADEIEVLIFDEVDAGIGGNTAETVGRKLLELSQGRQVICITHLAQIASLAGHHLRIEKQEIKDGVKVIITEMTGEERVKEIARMLSGNITESSLIHAEELLQRGVRKVRI